MIHTFSGVMLLQFLSCLKLTGVNPLFFLEVKDRLLEKMAKESVKKTVPSEYREILLN